MLAVVNTSLLAGLLAFFGEMQQQIEQALHDTSEKALHDTTAMSAGIKIDSATTLPSIYYMQNCLLQMSGFTYTTTEDRRITIYTLKPEVVVHAVCSLFMHQLNLTLKDVVKRLECGFQLPSQLVSSPLYPTATAGTAGSRSSFEDLKAKHEQAKPAFAIAVVLLL